MSVPEKPYVLRLTVTLEVCDASGRAFSGATKEVYLHGSQIVSASPGHTPSGLDSDEGRVALAARSKARETYRDLLASLTHDPKARRPAHAADAAATFPPAVDRWVV